MTKNHWNTRLGLTMAALLIGLLAALPATAQVWAGKARVQGQVKDENGKPLEGVRITLSFDGEEGQGPEAFYSNKKGRWSYLGLAAGQWQVVLEMEGYLISEGNMQVSEFGRPAILNTGLTPIPEEMKAAQKAEEIVGWVEAGNRLVDEGKYAAARTEYERALEFLDTDRKPPLLQAMARTYYEEGDSGQAIGMLEQALEIDSDNVDSLKLIIHLLTSAGREADAQAYVARLPQGESMDVNTLLNLGIELFNKSDLAGAFEHFDRAVKEHPDSGDALYYRGLVHMNRGESEAAIADFGALLELDAAYAKAEEVKQFIEYLQGSE